ncbi:ATP-binding protein [Leptospira gomenensis]|uniref:ATP-binding protein n=1 Tax=Leptospira gomenensis TaxID=2484974 RepID=A0A5F1YYN3_9LEPT|nr:ATP-binding protein [Leptospira gomenensis]TGK35980.1 ATP-binding protein [Leptospira gomenensis]TGK39989.1 ATP-binding protein [Leptospira gomenensis]TGK51438.1 ATP-binding protein [Leptospira gomenensis]TGK64887.1 ATP-binding protein [Leptospira gomenensis]
MNLTPEILICSLFLFLSSVLLWLGATTAVNLERRDGSATFAISILGVSSLLFGFLAWIGRIGLFAISALPALYFFPGIFCLILIPFGWFFIIVWFLGKLRKWNVYRFFFALLLFSQFFAFVFLPVWSSKFNINISLFTFWYSIPFSFRISYLIYIGFCIFIPVVSLYYYETPSKILLDTARIRAVPYLKTVSLSLSGVLVLVSLLFLGGETKLIPDPVQQSARNPVLFYGILIGIQSLILFAVLVLGHALISYEIFTGRILPKISLRKEWRNAVLGFFTLCVIYVLSASFRIPIATVEIFIAISYSTILTKTFVLYKNKRLRMERNAVLSSILISEDNSENYVDIEDRFRRSFDLLCSDILETSKALFVNESKIPFVTDLYLRFPAGNGSFETVRKYFGREADRNEILYLDESDSSEYVLCLRIEHEHSGIGLFFLGKKIDGGLYAEEEIEIARSAASWILHSLFLESNSLTLSSLQRKHMEEQRILDYKTRQMLHDEILPEIHSSILTLSQNENEPAFKDQIRILTDLHKKVSSFVRELPDTGLEIGRLGLIETLKRRVDAEFDPKRFDWNFDPKLNLKFPISSPETLEILFYACRETIRNAAKHSGKNETNKIMISFFENDKRGILIRVKNTIETDKSQSPSVASTEQGLKIHSALLKIFGGYLTLEFLNANEALTEIFLPEQN